MLNKLILNKLILNKLMLKRSSDMKLRVAQGVSSSCTTRCIVLQKAKQCNTTRDVTGFLSIFHKGIIAIEYFSLMILMKICKEIIPDENMFNFSPQGK